jgi:hypothetical protein
LRLSGADKEERLARTEQLPVVPPSDSESFHSLVGSAQSSTAALMVAAAADSPVASKKRKHANSDSDPLDAAALRALLASLVVSALSKLFEFDSSSSDAQFLDEDRFENLLPSLCEQVELAAADRSPSEYTLFVESSLMPAFVSLAVRVNAEAQVCLDCFSFIFADLLFTQLLCSFFFCSGRRSIRPCCCARVIRRRTFDSVRCDAWPRFLFAWACRTWRCCPRPCRSLPN